MLQYIQVFSLKLPVQNKTTYNVSLILENLLNGSYNWAMLQFTIQ
jgi:hypothetical protein